MTNLTDQIERTLIQEGFKVKHLKHHRARNNKIDIRKEGFDEDIVINDSENKKEIWIIFVEYLKDITHNLTVKNIKRTFRLVVDISKWLWKK